MAKQAPNDRLYSEEHEWVKMEGNDALIGISDHAQASLGDVVYVELPDVGQEIKMGSAIGVVESVKAVSDIYAPISGMVKAINPIVIEHPEKINQDPYGEGWLFLIEIKDKGQEKSLLSPLDYQKMLELEAK
jgi:glycine cleavage system H protein